MQSANYQLPYSMHCCTAFSRHCYCVGLRVASGLRLVRLHCYAVCTGSMHGFLLGLPVKFWSMVADLWSGLSVPKWNIHLVFNKLICIEWRNTAEHAIEKLIFVLNFYLMDKLDLCIIMSPVPYLLLIHWKYETIQRQPSLSINFTIADMFMRTCYILVVILA